MIFSYPQCIWFVSICNSASLPPQQPCSSCTLYRVKAELGPPPARRPVSAGARVEFGGSLLLVLLDRRQHPSEEIREQVCACVLPGIAPSAKYPLVPLRRRPASPRPPHSTSAAPRSDPRGVWNRIRGSDSDSVPIPKDGTGHRTLAAAAASDVRRGGEAMRPAAPAAPLRPIPLPAAGHPMGRGVCWSAIPPRNNQSAENQASWFFSMYCALNPAHPVVISLWRCQAMPTIQIPGTVLLAAQ